MLGHDDPHKAKCSTNKGLRISLHGRSRAIEPMNTATTSILMIFLDVSVLLNGSSSSE